MPHRCAILDDYQSIALKSADWSTVVGELDLKVFTAPIGSDDAVIAALKDFSPALKLLTLPDSVATRRAAAAGVEAIGEAFADRGYRDDGRLQPRGEPGALLTGASEVTSRALAWLRGGMMPSVDGKPFELEARSLCVHGDTPGAVAMAAALREALLDAGIELAAFT